MDSNCPPPPSPRGGPSVCIVNDQDPLLQRFTMLLFFFFLRSCYHHCETKNLTHVECWGGGTTRVWEDFPHVVEGWWGGGAARANGSRRRSSKRTSLFFFQRLSVSENPSLFLCSLFFFFNQIKFTH